MDSEWLRIVATFVVGQLSVIGIEWFRSWLTRDQRRRDARDEFQRQTSIELQEVLYRLVRALSNALHEYQLLSEGKPAPVWPTEEDPRLIGAGVFARIDALAERVDDPRVRDLVSQYLDQHENMFSAPKDSSIEVVRQQLADLRIAQHKANKRIGQLLREP